MENSTCIYLYFLFTFLTFLKMTSNGQFDVFRLQGEKLNLQGLELVRYVQDCVDRDERAKKREAERQEREAERLEREAERASREKIEFVKLKLEQNGGLDTARDTSHSVPRNNPRLPICKENTDSIDSFLFRFESHATALKWPRSDWPVLLSAILEGQALSLYHVRMVLLTTEEKFVDQISVQCRWFQRTFSCVSP